MASVDGTARGDATSAWPTRLLFLAVVGTMLLDIPLFVFTSLTPSLPPKFLFVAAFLLALAAGVATQAFSGRMMALGAAIVVYASFNVLALGWSSNAEGAMRELVTRVTGLSVLFLTALVTSHARQRIRVPELVAVLAVAAAVLCLLDVLNGYRWTSVPGRAAGSFINPNAAAASVTFLTIAGIRGVPEARRPWYLVFTGFAAVITLSRGGYVMLLTSLLILGVGAQYSLRALLRASVTTAAVLSVVLTVGLKTVLDDRPEVAIIRAIGPATLLRLDAGDAASTSERRQVAEAAADLFDQHQLLGAGLTATTAWTLPVSTHNEPLRIAAELGVLGLAAFGVLVVTVFVVGRAHVGPIGAALVCWMLILLAVSHNVLEGWSHLASLGLLAGGSQIEENGLVTTERKDP